MVTMLRLANMATMISMGVIDPAKVTRSALQHAASVSGLMLTTEAMVSEKASRRGRCNA